MNSKIKIYSLESHLSSICDEVIDECKEMKLTFHIRDPIDLTLGHNYELRIEKNNKSRGRYAFVFNNLNIFDVRINPSNDADLLSRTSKSPFKVELYNSGHNLLGRGLFYRYRSAKRTTNPSNWDRCYNPREHQMYTPSPRRTITPSIPRNNYSINYPTPERSNSNISLSSIQSLRYSQADTTSSRIRYSTPTQSERSRANHNYNLNFEQGFFNKSNHYLNILNETPRSIISDDSDESNDNEYDFVLRNDPSDQYDSLSRISINSQSRVDLFQSIESISELNCNVQGDEKFYSFTLKCTLNNTDTNYKQVGDNVYVSDMDKIMVSNHALRKLKKDYNVRIFASFKLEIREEKTKIFQDDLTQLLINGIPVEINGKTTKFFYVGHSNSGMREHNFWAIDEQSLKSIDFDRFVKSMGNFTQFLSIDKLSKRFGQFFSSSKPSITLSRDEFKTIEDETNYEGLEFTDGIGLIRLKTCKEISELIGLEYTSNIFQVRCGGFKGMLVGFPDQVFDSILYQNNYPITPKIKVIFRKSQLKFESDSLELNIVSWSSFDSSPASLNSEFLMVLDGLSGHEFKTYIIKLFKEYLDDFEASLIDPKKAVSKLFNSNELTEFSHKYKMILLACQKDLSQELDPKQYKIIRELLIEQYLYNLITKRRLSIQIEKSRYLIGVLDETGTLNEGEIFVSYRDYSGKMVFLNGTDCIVGRTPCYSLSEIRRVKTRYIPELEHLENCIVFPKKGKRPLTYLLSGGDLDGDFYFVSWDEILTKIENNNDLIEYPKSKNQDGYVNLKNLRTQLVNHYVKQVLNQDGIGLWHYFLTSLYDSDRTNMTTSKYLDAVVEINKCIDGIPTTKSKYHYARKPDWYITSQELNGVEGLAKKEDKFIELAKILKRKNLSFAVVDLYPEDFSILCSIAQMSIKKFIDISNRSVNYNGSFLSQTEIDLLVTNKRIRLNLTDINLKELNKIKIKREYLNYVEKIKELESKSKTERNNKLYIGAFERQVKEDTVLKKDQVKAKLTQKFRDYVISLPYSNDSVLNESIQESMNQVDGYFFRSRLVCLYLDMKDDDLYYQIPWIFYDVLCYLKNYCNDKQCGRTSLVLPDLVPFNIPASCTKAFSVKKLSNFSKY